MDFDESATILYIRDVRPIRMQVQLEEPFYNTVIQAFQLCNPIRVNEDIYRVGSGYELCNPRKLSMMGQS